MNNRTRPLRVIALAGALLAVGGSALAQGGVSPGKRCFKSALAARQASSRAALAEFWAEIAIALNNAKFDDALEAAKQAQKKLKAESKLIKDQFQERTDLCQELGQSPYDPDIDPDDFSSDVDHAYFTLIQGRTLTYEAATAGGLRRVESETLAETRTIMGVECAVVVSLELLDGDEMRRTRHYYAQHDDGTVWQFGALSFGIEDDLIVDMDGTWIAGTDGARPGVVMPAAADLGLVFRQAFALNVAEDVGRFIATGKSVDVPYNGGTTYNNCWQIRVETPLEPGQAEQRYFAQGIGLVKARDVKSGDVLELVDIAP